jgi:CRISPR-associated endonuclease/helicase Cas3
VLDDSIAHWRSSDQTPQPLKEHLTGVGALARTFASKLGLGSAGELLGLLHDLGKYSREFQGYIRSAVGILDTDNDEYVDAGLLKGKVDHSSAGAQYLWNALSGHSPKGRLVGQVLALCVASHHSGLIDCIGASGEDVFAKRMKKAKDRTHLDEVQSSADEAILLRCGALLENHELVESVSYVVERILRSSLVGRKIQGSIAQQQIGLAVRLLFSCLIDADRIDTADFEHKRVKTYRPRGEYVAWQTLIDRLERHLQCLSTGSPIDALRSEISRHCLDAASRNHGVYTLTVPTGGGKTLASLRFALHHARRHNLDRIIFAVPFTSIIDQNAETVRAILEPERESSVDTGRVVLEHHSSITPEQQSWREKVLCENWDAPIVYTTMVQFLEALFGAGTRGARRMHQLANAVLIFDEVQTVPIKCVHLFNNAINYLTEHCNSTAVLCTATQPLLNRVASEKGAIRLGPQHEIMPDVPKLFDVLRRVEVRDRRKAGGWDYDEIASLALEEVRRAGSCLVVVNTKDAAQRVFERCGVGSSDDGLFHLSTSMCPAHRKQNLAEIRRRLASGLPTLCVSTQLIEAGVDVDFGVVIRFLAGLDSIAQAAGRCNRNGRRERGVVHVINVRSERLDKLPDISIGRDKAERVLDDLSCHPARYGGNILGPEALSDYFRYYFFDRQGEMDYPVSANVLGHDDTLLNVLSGNSLAVAEFQRREGRGPDVMLNQSFMTAAKAFKSIDAPTEGVVVPFGDRGREIIADLHGAFDVEREYDLLREAQQYTVNVFPHVLETLKTAGALSEVKAETRILSVDERYYSTRFGLATEPVATMDSLYVG